jgi:hypothetical protein
MSGSRFIQTWGYRSIVFFDRKTGTKYYMADGKVFLDVLDYHTTYQLVEQLPGSLDEFHGPTLLSEFELWWDKYIRFE